MSQPGEIAQRFGIQRDYLDNADEPVRLAGSTVEALSAAIGEPDAELAGRAPVFLRPGSPWSAECLRSGGVAVSVELESGEQREYRPDTAPDLPLGYHWLHTPSGRRRLVVSPGRCRRPERHGWGWTAQLYATRSAGSWGIGDLADLRRLTELAAGQGAGFVLVNPLHAGGSTAVDQPQQPSPYFPSSRRFFSPLYLAVAEIPGAAEALGPDTGRLAAAAVDEKDPRHIDRDAIWRIKRPALRRIFDATGAARSSELAGWRQQRGQGIEDFAAWCVLSERYGGNWWQWPEGARRPDGPLVRQVAGQQPDDVAFAAWLQWQAEGQLRAAGRAVSVLQDLPIGVDPNGADAWSYQDVLASGVTVGAPPDPFNQAGQDWGLPPFVPWRLRAAGYEPFIDAIRATIAHAGGLRIDHVMGLFRLWWIPAGESADRGGYVRYPSDDLLDIVALESARAGAPVVGEDLGTVEPGVREELAERNVLSYRLLWFEPEPPSQWPEPALAAVSTHDLPTVAGLWDGSDLADQRAAGLDADEQATTDLRQLLTDRAGVDSDATPAEAVLGAYRLLAQAPSVLMGASLDDALAEPARPNMPGTIERPNWSIALPVPLEEFAGHSGMRALAEVLNTAVTGTAPEPTGSPAL